MEIFNQEAVYALDLTDDVRIIPFIKALLPNSRLAFELSWRNPTNVEEMYVVAHKHMVAQELLSQRRPNVN